MSLELCILASGSSGNASILRTPAGTLLIDAGICPRTCSKRLIGTGTTIADISAILLTHLDSDHFNPTWLRTILASNIHIFCHENRANELLAHCAALPIRNPQSEFRNLITTFNGHAFHPLPGLTAHPIPLAHDQLGSHGFLLQGFNIRIGYATDLGHVPDHLLNHFRNLDLLALESNYDPQMQLASSRPYFLKQRIMGGAGHLSNDQALAAIQQILDHAQATNSPLPSHIVLLHRSRQCNCPRLVRKLFSADARIASRLTLAHQYERSEWLRVAPSAPKPHEQLTLAW